MSKKTSDEILDTVEADIEKVMKKHGVKAADVHHGPRRWWIDREDDGADKTLSICIAVKKTEDE